MLLITLISYQFFFFAVTVEGLKAKLQKKEREVDSKKQELVSE